MVSEHRKNSPLSILLALGSLVLILILLGYYFENCFKDKVLGVSTFNSASSKDPVVNGESFNFKATVVGDQAGILNATVLFTLTGGGVLGSNIQGVGQCLKLTDTTAACNNVDVDPNQTIVWTVPATANSSCSQGSPASVTLQTRLVSTLTTSTSTASVSCVASQPSATTPSNATTAPTTGGNNTTTNTTTSKNNDGSKGGGLDQSFDIAGFSCTKVNGFPLVFILLILWLLASGYYFLIRNRN